MIISKCSADEACQKKSSQDFFDKLNSSRCEMQRELFGVVGGVMGKSVILGIQYEAN